MPISKEQCRDIADSRGQPLLVIKNYSKTSVYPPGCYYYKEGNKMIYNPYLLSTNECTADRVCMCQKCKIYFFFISSTNDTISKLREKKLIRRSKKNYLFLILFTSESDARAVSFLFRFFFYYKLKLESCFQPFQEGMISLLLRKWELNTASLEGKGIKFTFEKCMYSLSRKNDTPRTKIF